MNEPLTPAQQEALRTERERVRALLWLLPVGVLIVDARGRRLETNDAFDALWGTGGPPVESAEEYRLFEGYRPDTGKRLEAHEWPVARTLRTGEAVLNEEVDIVAFDGARRTLLLSTAPLRGPDGALLGAVAINVDITARKATERSEAFLSAASRLLGESLDWETTLKAVARLATRELCDYCMVDLLGEDGKLHRLALAAKDAERQPLLDEALPYPPRIDGDTPLARAFREGQPVLVPELTPEWLATQARSPEHLQVLERLAPRSVMLLPLAVGSRRFGLINLASAAPGRRYTERELGPAEEFVRRASYAMENARLYREQQQALRARDTSLALLRAFLDASPTGMAYLDRELRYVQINPALARLNGLPPEAHLGRTPREVLGPGGDIAAAPLRRVLATGEPLLDLAFTLPDPETSETRHALGSYFPIQVGTETVGVGGVVADVTDQKRVEEDLRFMAEATTRLSGSLELGPTLESVARLVVERLADYCVVDVVAEDGQRLERLAVLGRDVETERLVREALPFAPPPGSGSPVRRVLRTGQPELVGEMSEAWMESAILAPEHRELMRRLRPRSMMLVPLLARGRTLGVLTAASRDGARRFSGRDLAFLEDLAQRAALAVDNARLFQKAEQAVSARDEFVAIATHELRTPLSALNLQLASLRRAVERGTPPTPERLGHSLDTALRQTQRLEQLVSHLFDVSRISTGRLELEREEVDLTAMAQRLATRFEETLAQVRSAAVVHAQGPVVARVDRLRVEQVLMNLLSNAMKYAPGQPVELSVEARDGEATVSVQDAGPGIPPDMQARIFERFQRASGEHSRSSLGLGLYISRQIARAHGGDLTVESTPGHGARFTLRLPRD